MVGGLLATLIGAMNRSSAGFSDRDAWCLMLAILAVTTYLMSLGARKAAGSPFMDDLRAVVLFFSGGMSWEAFRVFYSALILTVELWKFCTTKTEDAFKGIRLMVADVRTVALPCESLRIVSGYGFATHIAVLTANPAAGCFPNPEYKIPAPRFF